jgi:hypothetical protein
MFRPFPSAVFALAILVPALGDQGDIRRGKIKKVDACKETITITADGKDHTFTVTDDTRLADPAFKPIQDRLKDRRFRPGVPVMFKAIRRDGHTVLLGLKLIGPNDRGNEPVKVDTSRLKALTELGKNKYHGYEGGLYPGGKNERPARHEKAGVALCRKVRPLDADGKPDVDGKTVLISVGMSNTVQAFSAFKELADADEDKNPRLVLVNAAQGGAAAMAMVDPSDDRRGKRYWRSVDQRLEDAGVTRGQVQVVWIKQADPGPTAGFPKYAQTLQTELTLIVQILARRFPNVKLVYLSSRTYGGYAKTRLNPEPYAYESGFSVKWLIERQLKGDAALNYDSAKGRVAAPWLSWGPYLWANGTTKRADGFRYEEKDFAGDGTHESASGQRKVGKLLLQFFKSDTTAKGWFVKKE